MTQVVGAFELREQRRRRLAEKIHQDVQAPAMRHADHDLLDFRATALLDEIIEERQERVAAFEREALLADVAGVEIALQPLGGSELPEDVALLLRREALLQHAGLELILQPEPLPRLRHVRELGPDRAAIDGLELVQDVAQLHPLRHRLGATGGEELGVEIGRSQAEILEIEHRRPRPLGEAQGVELRDQVAAIDPDLDEPRDRRLLGVHAGVRRPYAPRYALRASRGRLLACTLGERRFDRALATLCAFRPREAVEVAPPLVLYARRIAQVLLVEGIEKGGVAAEERCRFQHGEGRTAKR